MWLHERVCLCICLLFTERIFNENGSFAQRIYSSTTTTTTTTKITRSATNLFSCVTNLTDSFPEFNFQFIKCSADDVVDTPTEIRYCVNICRVYARCLWEGQRWDGAIRIVSYHLVVFAYIPPNADANKYIIAIRDAIQLEFWTRLIRWHRHSFVTFHSIDLSVQFCKL